MAGNRGRPCKCGGLTRVLPGSTEFLDKDNMTKRRRVCLQCRRRFTTYEIESKKKPRPLSIA